MKSMSKILFILFCFAPVSSVLASQCQYTGTKQASMPTKQKPEAKVVSVNSKKPTFTVTLPANATTGYQWFLVSCNDRLIQPLSHTYLAPQNKHMMGAPGQSQWQFKVTAAGLAVPRVVPIVLAYARPWQPSDRARQYHILVVTQ